MDTLTKLPDRTAIREDWASGKYRHSCLLLLDLDLFQAYNDHFGHTLGDTVLQKVASALAEVAKRYEGVVYRVGGDDFIVVVPNHESLNTHAIASDAQIAVHSMQIPFEHSEVLAKHEDYLTVSIGVACTELTDAQSLEEIWERADKALYKAKNQRPGGISFWSNDENSNGVN